MSVVLPTGTRRKELGYLLVSGGVLTPEQLRTALARQEQTGRALGQVVIDLGLAGEEDVTRARAKQVDAAYVCLDDLVVDKSVLPLISAAVAHKYQLLPVARTPDGTLKIVVAAWNARSMEVAQKIASAHRLRVAPALASEGALRAALTQFYGESPVSVAAPAVVSAVPAVVPAVSSTSTLDKRASDVFARAPLAGFALPALAEGAAPDALDTMGVDQPVVIQFISRILLEAIACGASDIHFEPRRDALEVRFRQDGTLRSVDTVPAAFQLACASRLKIMAEMNIAERRLPQDGRISVTLEGRVVDMRVSSLPTQYGESLVLRILDKNGVRPELSQLGLSPRNLSAFSSLIRKPHGIFLVTGPTGSGKTTTLYSAIQQIHSPDVNIITVEDPIEYELDGIRQSNVNEKAGLTFARQLRAILRQDPDIIYVGEIRDHETAEIAFRAALTGHMVFSTLHCNDAAGAITRLLNMGVDPFLVASSVVGILAQRLVRKVCVKCTRPTVPTGPELIAFGVDTDAPEYHAASFREGAGCEVCGGTGYKGRHSVQELLVMDDTLRGMVLAHEPSNRIRQTATERGMIPMRRDAALKVMTGLTTFDEAQKRVYVEETGEE